MNYPKLSILVFAGTLFLIPPAKAQIVGKSTDSNYYNTTIIYKKGDLKDTEVLQKVENDYGMGDIIRIADAPVKPKVEPAGKAPQRALLLNTATKPVVQPVVTVTPKAIKAIPVPEKTIMVAPAKEEVKQVKTTPSVKSGAVTGTGSKSVKSVKKKSGTSKMRYKAPKKTKQRGKQRYGCPKF